MVIVGKFRLLFGKGKLTGKSENSQTRWSALDIRFEAYGKDIMDSGFGSMTGSLTQF